MLPQGICPAATSIQFFPKLVNKSYALVAGLENGQISIWNYNEDLIEWELIHIIHLHLTHGLSVKRMRFGRYEDNKYTLATCGNDHTVRVFIINMD